MFKLKAATTAATNVDNPYDDPVEASRDYGGG
jgi:hypothetical protein